MIGVTLQNLAQVRRQREVNSLLIQNALNQAFHLAALRGHQEELAKLQIEAEQLRARQSEL